MLTMTPPWSWGRKGDVESGREQHKGSQRALRDRRAGLGGTVTHRHCQAITGAALPTEVQRWGNQQERWDRQGGRKSQGKVAELEKQQEITASPGGKT